MNYLKILLNIVCVLCISSSVLTLYVEKEKPCSFFDTVNITDSLRNSDGSYQYFDIVIPENYTKMYDYIHLTSKFKKFKVPPHLRGCVCLFKKCIKMCSGPNIGKFLGKPMEDLTSKDNKIEIMKGDSLEIVPLIDEFAVQEGRPCEILYDLTSDDNFTIFENGTLFRNMDRVYLEKQDFCMSSYNAIDGKLSPLVCFPDDGREDEIKEIVQAAGESCLIINLI